MFREPATRQLSGSSIEVNTAIFAGSITNFFQQIWQTRLLDTLDHFDYDSACTMILNLESFRASQVGLELSRLTLIKASGEHRCDI